MKHNKAQVAVFFVIVLLITLIILGILIVLPIYNVSITGNVISIDTGESQIISKNYDFEDFDEIRIEGSGNLFLTQGDDYSVRIEAEEKIMEILEVYIEGDTLVIGKQRTLLLATKPINIFVSMPEIKEIKVSGSGNIKSKNKINQEKLEIVISGSGNVEMDLDVDDLTTKVSGSGDFNYHGKADIHEIVISGSGDVNAFNLISDETIIVISGSGDADVYVIEQLGIRISGSGDVNYKGSPQISQSFSGSGKVRSV